MNRVVEKTAKFEGADDEYGFPEYGGVLIVMDCGHEKRWEGWFPVPIPMPGDEHECSQCDTSLEREA
jgi:hypothetical protein